MGPVADEEILNLYFTISVVPLTSRDWESPLQPIDGNGDWSKPITFGR
jgi:hypothetical protein